MFGSNVQNFSNTSSHLPNALVKQLVIIKDFKINISTESINHVYCFQEYLSNKFSDVVFQTDLVIPRAPGME